MINQYSSKSAKRKARVRSVIKGTSERPRLSVYRSTKQISAQIINDQKQITLASFSSLKLKTKGKNKLDTAKLVGENIAKAAKLKKITKVVFDRGPYKYHGRVKALAEASRKVGLKF